MEATTLFLHLVFTFTFLEVSWQRYRKHHPERIVRVIRQLQADVVGLQEVESHFGPGNNLPQVEYLAEATGMTAIPGPTIRSRQNSSVVAIRTHLGYYLRRRPLKNLGMKYE